jgi:uncharacterized membrane protein
MLAVLTITMLVTIAQYSSFSATVGFLQYKQDYIGNSIWKTAFYIHVFSCFLCLLAGFTQFSKYVLTNYKPLHRFIGKMYAYNILLINFPAGMMLAICANGHLPSKIAFITLDILWFIFTAKAVACIREGNIKKHKEFMIRSYALTLSAVSLRLWKQVFIHVSSIDTNTIYMIDAWLGFIPNLLVAEWIIRTKKQQLSRQADIVYNNNKG